MNLLTIPFLTELAALRRDIDSLPTPQAQAFLKRYEGQAVAENFRSLWLASLSALACMLVWWHDGRNGLNSAWATAAVPAISVVLGLACLLIWLRPRWHDRAAALCTASVAVYFIGSLISATRTGGPEGLYEMASNAQIMPLLYLAAAEDAIAAPPSEAELTSALGPLAKRVVIERAGHALLPEQPEAVAAALIAEVRALWG